MSRGKKEGSLMEPFYQASFIKYRQKDLVYIKEEKTVGKIITVAISGDKEPYLIVRKDGHIGWYSDAELEPTTELDGHLINVDIDEFFDLDE